MKRSRTKDVLATALACMTMCFGAPLDSWSQSATVSPATSESAPAKPPLKPEELEQLLAPIALYPDSLLTQVLMSSTYPLEIVQAARWQKANKDLKGDALAKELEKQEWDPSVKSMVNFPDVLALMNDKLDLTVKLGDAFIEQQADVMNTVQKLRAKAQASGNLKSNEQQKIVVEAAPAPQPQTIVVQTAPPPQIITIESPSPDVIYVPTYNPTIVYGTWAYPAYPPYPYYPPRPPGYVATAAISFGVGVACGAAWGYAWGHSNWGHNDVDIDINRNTNFNTNINRNNYQGNFNKNNTNISGGKGSWQHNPAHRQGVAYRDQATAQKFGGANQSAQAAKARDAYRGRADSGWQGTSQGGANRSGAGVADRSAGAAQNRGGASVQDRAGGASAQNRAEGAGAQNRSEGAAQNRGGNAGQNRAGDSAQNRGGSSRGSAFEGAGSNGGAARSASQRGQASRGGTARSAPSRSGGGGARGGGGRR